MKYHVNNKTGKYGKCSAEKDKCPFLDSSIHVESLKEAKSVAETILNKKYGQISSMKKEKSSSDGDHFNDVENNQDTYHSTYKTIVSVKGKEARQSVERFSRREGLILQGIVDDTQEEHKKNYDNLKNYFLDGGYAISFGDNSNFLRHFSDENSYKVTDELIEKAKSNNLDNGFVEFLSKNKGAELGMLHGVKMTDVEKPSENMFDNELYRNVRKMPALFVIDRDKNEATKNINDSAAWIFEEEAKPTYKRDGTSITVDENGKVWARRSVKKGKKAPANYIEAEVDPITGHSFGLEPIEQSSFKKFYDEAEGNFDGALEAGTYELCGPKVQNAEGLSDHRLLRHGEDIAEEIPDMRNVPKDEAFEMLKNIFADYKQRGIEGVVWWGKDGKRTKLRVKDFFGDPNRR